MRFAAVSLTALLLASCGQTPAPLHPTVCPTCAAPSIVTRIVTEPPRAIPTTNVQSVSESNAVEMWVCVDLAVAHSAPREESAIVFQMSQVDGWKVKVLEMSSTWSVVRAGDMLAFMETSSLCESPPPTSVPTATATPAPTETALLIPTYPPLPTSPPPVLVQPTSIPLSPQGATPKTCPQGCISPPLGCSIKGNVAYETGEKIYRVPGGKFYASTVINPRYGERWFCTEDEARANGWRRSSQ